MLPPLFYKKFIIKKISGYTLNKNKGDAFMYETFYDDFNYELITESPEQKLVKLLLKKNIKISTAESCTGGLLSKKITDVPGVSQSFELGVCSYSNRIKNKILGVNLDTLDKFTAVSHQTAIEMASGILNLSGADIGISTTGFAGPPMPGSFDKVGLVFIGVSCKKLKSVIKLNISNNMVEERNFIRNTAVNHALSIAIKVAKDWSD